MLMDTHDNIPVRRHRLHSVESYDVTGDELDRIENESMQVGEDFAFASNTLTAFVAFLITLLTVEIKSDRTFMVFLAVDIATAILTAYFAVRWLRGRKKGLRIISRIRERQVGPLGSEDKEIKPSQLAQMSAQEPDKTTAE